MLFLAITAMVVAIIAAVLGFGGIAGSATGLSKLVFFLFTILFVAVLCFGVPKKD